MTYALDWRLCLPFGLVNRLHWLPCVFIPRLTQAASIQADARSEMTGRIVDTYTNMPTVKLFSTTDGKRNTHWRACNSF